MSPIDRIFFDIFGSQPKKAGTAYEMLSCIAEHLINQGSVIHDKKVRGEFSKTLYQIDVLSDGEFGKSMGEAKDYTLQNKKVGRGDLQKLGGALPDLPGVGNGNFYSATGYTNPAIKYAQASQIFPNGKPINLYEFRPSTEIDEEGTIKTIVIRMQCIIPHPQRGKWKPHLTEAGVNVGRSLSQNGERVEYEVLLEKFYNNLGEEILTLHELTSFGYGDRNIETDSAKGCYLLKNHFIKINELLVEIKGLEYDVPISIAEEIVEITDDSNCRFLIKDLNGNIIRFITDNEIKQYEFNEAGELITPYEMVPVSAPRR